MSRTFSLAVPLRWSDQDRNGHVNNARIVTLLEESRVYWRLAGIEEGGLDPSLGALIVVSLTVNYRQPVVLGPEVAIEVGVVSIGTRSLTLRHTGYQSNAIAFDATSVVVFPGPDGPRPIRDDERQWLSTWLAE
jgi:acyl-CoA thioester hydrolase